MRTVLVLPTLEAVNKGPIGWALSVWRFVRDVALRWYNERIGDLAASVTFWIVVSLPASILALLAALGPIDNLLGDSIDLKEAITDRLDAFISKVFTDESSAVADAVSGLFEQGNSGLLTVSLGVAIWSLSRGFSGLIRALEDIYDIEDRRPWYHTRFVAVVLGFGSMLISVPLVLAEQFIWNEISDGALKSGLRTVVAVVILVLWASIVLHYGPAKRHKWSYDLPGAVVVAVLWWLLTIGFSYYIGLDFANEIQSAVGTFLLALTWVWMAAQMLLIGGAVNYLFGERLGVLRNRRPWKINDVVIKSTGEIKKIVVPNGGASGGGQNKDDASGLEVSEVGADRVGAGGYLEAAKTGDQSGSTRPSVRKATDATKPLVIKAPGLDKVMQPQKVVPPGSGTTTESRPPVSGGGKAKPVYPAPRSPQDHL